MQAQVAQVRKQLPADQPRVFLYDSGEDRAMTSGRLGMPQALIDAAGGRNILDDVQTSWTRVNWEKIGRAHVELQSLMRISYAVFCLKKQNHTTKQQNHHLT